MQAIQCGNNLKDFNFEKYIWQIQFYPSFIGYRDCTYNITLDYLNRLLFIRITDNNTQTMKERIYDIDDESFEELLSYSEISKIQAFENKSEVELNELETGYRDCWMLKYHYFTHDKLPRADRSLIRIYTGNPIEDIAKWIRRVCPNETLWL